MLILVSFLLGIFSHAHIAAHTPFDSLLTHGAEASSIIYEDKYAMAFFDKYPRMPGHILVIPKKNCINILDCDADTLQHTFAMVQLIAHAEKQAFGADGVTIRQNNGIASEQTVFHLHFHVMPRHNGEAVDFNYHGKRPQLTEVDLQREMAQMKQALRHMGAADSNAGARASSLGADKAAAAFRRLLWLIGGNALAGKL